MKNFKVLAQFLLLAGLTLFCLTSCVIEGATTKHVCEFSAPTCTEPGICKCGETMGEALGHDIVIDEAVAPTCTQTGLEAGEHCSRCDYKVEQAPIAALGHTIVVDEAVAATCTQTGLTAGEHCSVCDYKVEQTVVDIDPENHSYTPVVTAPTCKATGYTTYTCACGDSYVGDETPMADHIDTNLDITCDFEGCTTRILPEDGSEISFFTATSMIIVSTSRKYYVQGVVVEVTDAKNGIFIIADETGAKLLVRLPKDADGNAYTAWTNKVVLGDTIRMYGTPKQNTSSPTSVKAKIESGILTVVSHTHDFSDPTCTKESVCACLAVNAPALGHADENGDGLCDRCSWNMNLQVSYVDIRTDADGIGVMDAATPTKWTWDNGEFSAVISKGNSTYTLYKTAKTYMQLKKNNFLDVSVNGGGTIHTVTIAASNATQLGYLVTAANNCGFTFTQDAASFSITIEWNSAEPFHMENLGTSTIYVDSVEIAYEK